MHKCLLVCCCLFYILFNANAQVGREFWFVAPDATSSHGEKPIFFRITTFDTGTNVTIDFPANTGIAPLNTYIPANTQYTTPENVFPLNAIENQPTDVVLNKGVRIIAHDADICAYYEIANPNNPDKFTLKGRNALGNEFFIPSQDSYGNNLYHNPWATEKIDIVATENDTHIEIIPTADVVGHAKGSTISITLNKGQTYCVENRNRSKGSSLAGTYVGADKPIAVTVSDDSLQNNDGGSAHDLIGDQMISTNVIGTEYVVVNTSTDDVSYNKGATLREVYVLATEDGTAIYLNGSNTSYATLNKGEQEHITITNDNMLIESTKPVYVYQLASLRFDGDGNEIGSALLPHASCTGSEVVAVKRIFSNEFYLQLMVKGKDRSNFTVVDSDGVGHDFLNAVSWKKVKGTDDSGDDDAWYTANIRLSGDVSTDKVYFVRNTGGLFHLSILEENRSSVSYGYFSSYSNLNVNGITEGCRGDHILLTTLEPMKSYEWHSTNDPATVISTSQTCEADETGTYWVKAEVAFGGCVLTDSIYVEFNQPEVDLGPDQTVCPGTILTFGDGSSSNSFEWSTGDTTREVDVNVSDGFSKELRVLVTDAEGCSNRDTVQISAYSVPAISLNTEEVCEGQRIINTTGFKRYEWRFGGVLLNNDPSQNYIEPQSSGVYQLTAWTADDCSVSQDFDITVHSLPTVSLSDITECEGVAATINGPTGAGYTYNWSTGATSSTVSIATAGQFWLEVIDANGCVDQDTAYLDFHMPIPIDLGDDRDECAETTLSLVNSSDYSDFTWKYDDGVAPIKTLTNQTPENQYLIAPALKENSGTYIVEAKDINGCEVSDQVNVVFWETNPPTLFLTQNLCRGESIEIIASPGYNNYNWSYNGNPLPAFNDQDTIVVSLPGKYILTATETSLGCTKSSDIDVVQHELPTVQLPADYDICPGTDTDVSLVSYDDNSGANPFDYLFWGTESDKRFSNYTSAKLNINSAGTYQVTVVDKLGCEDTDEIVIGIHTLPSLDLGAPQSECENIGVLLVNPIKPQTSNYEWYKVESASDVLLISDNDYLATVSGTYKLDIVDNNGCAQSDELIVEAKSVPTVDLGPDVSICQFESIDVAPDKDYTQYRWNDDPTLNTQTISVNASGTYKLEVANTEGCWAQDEMVVNVLPAPVFDIPDPAPVCADTAIVLNGPAGMLSYLWSTYETSQSVTKYAGTYNLHVVHPNGCEYEDEVRISNNPAPDVSIGIDTTICPIGGFVNLNAGPGFASYKWHNGKITQEILAELHDTINVVTVTNRYGCINSADRLVIPMVPPALELLNDTAICQNDSLELDGSDEFLFWEWSTGSNDRFITVKDAGEYRLRASNGCYWQADTMHMVVNETPVMTRIDSTIYAQIVLYPSGGTEPYQYAINDGSWQNENVFKGIGNGEHEFCVEDANGCQARASVFVFNNLDIEVPNFVTPNGDGYNDTWEIKGLERLPDSEVRIYDRYGKLLIRYKVSEPGWDGKYLGKPVRSDDYWYVIELIPVNKLLKGNITLQR